MLIQMYLEVICPQEKKGLVALHLLCKKKEKDVLGLLEEKLTSWEVTHYPSLGTCPSFCGIHRVYSTLLDKG